MKSIQFKMSRWLTLGVAFLASACGTGVDPVKIVVGSDALPRLSYFSSQSATSFTTLQVPFTASTPYWGINAGFSVFNSGTYLSPADGVIAQIGTATINSTNTNFVTIAHSSRLATRFYGLGSIVVRAGDSVLKGQAVGVFIGAGNITFQVLLDGTPVCPLSFMDDQFRSLSQFSTFGQSPCQ